MKTLLLLSLCLPLISYARTEICPDLSPTLIAPQIDVTVKFKKKTGVYTYIYRVTNLPEARVPLWKFSLEADSEPLSVTAGKAWQNVGYNKETREISWNYNSNLKNATPLKPGKSADHFAIESKKPPQLVRVFADGDVTDVPTVKFENDEEEKDPDVVPCVGFFKGEGNREQVAIVTTGPALNRIETSIRIKRSQEVRWKGHPEEQADLILSPVEDGALELVVFDGPGVDVSKIDLNSLEFGTGRAKINPAKVVIRAGFNEPTDADAYAHVQKYKGKYLKVEFAMPDLQLRCNADRALFLTGRFQDGRELFGAARVDPVACDEKTFAAEAERQRSKR